MPYKDFSVQMDQILKEYDSYFRRQVDKAFDLESKETAKTLRSTSPKRPGRGQYAKSWTSKTAKGSMSGQFEAVVYNKNHYQLTHLLENGHVLKNGYGVQKPGRVNGIKHILPAQEKAGAALPQLIKKELE